MRNNSSGVNLPHGSHKYKKFVSFWVLFWTVCIFLEVLIFRKSFVKKEILILKPYNFRVSIQTCAIFWPWIPVNYDPSILTAKNSFVFCFFEENLQVFEKLFGLNILLALVTATPRATLTLFSCAYPWLDKRTLSMDQFFNIHPFSKT